MKKKDKKPEPKKQVKRPANKKPRPKKHIEARTPAKTKKQGAPSAAKEVVVELPLGHTEKSLAGLVYVAAEKLEETREQKEVFNKLPYVFNALPLEADDKAPRPDVNFRAGKKPGEVRKQVDKVKPKLGLLRRFLNLFK